MRKMCAKCGENKSIECFGKKKDTKDGRCSACKACESERLKKWREENKETVAAYIGQWREANREKMLEQMQRYGETHHETIREKQREWRKANKQKIADCHSAYGQTPAGKAANARGQRKLQVGSLGSKVTIS